MTKLKRGLREKGDRRRRGVKEYFYGWYFRCQGECGTLAVIPAVHISHREKSCSVQIITDKGSWSKVFPIGRFWINRKKGMMQIGENLFSRKGIRLRIETRGKDAAVISGTLQFGKFAEPGYDIMGPFRYVAGMECRHAVYSMLHSVYGKMMINGESFRFCQRKGYMEGDSGCSFPETYAWTQHFLKNGSFMLAAAVIPLMRLKFTGTVGILFWKGKEYRFATYLGASVCKIKDREILIRQGRYVLKVRFAAQTGRVLSAPQSGEMTRRIRENISGAAEYTLMYKGRIFLKEVTDKAAFECEWK